MPSDVWYIYEIAEIIGADALRLQDWANRFPERFSVDGSRITSSAGLERLLDAAEWYGCKPDVVRLKWTDWRERGIKTHSNAGGGTSISASISLEQVRGLLAEQAAEHTKQLSLMAGCIADLTAVVAAQQQEIAELREAATVARIQTVVGEQAIEHVDRLLASTIAHSEKLVGARGCEICVAPIVHKGSMAIRRSSSTHASTSSHVAHKQSSASSVRVGLELKGIATKLAGAKLRVGVDTSKAEQRVEELSQQERRAASELFEGTFEIQYQGVAIKVGQ